MKSAAVLTRRFRPLPAPIAPILRLFIGLTWALRGLVSDRVSTIGAHWLAVFLTRAAQPMRPSGLRCSLLQKSVEAR